jgi:hypothetical protein
MVNDDDGIVLADGWFRFLKDKSSGRVQRTLMRSRPS